MNLRDPYGTGNHRRIRWRKAWQVSLEGEFAAHMPTGFTVRFDALVDGRVRMRFDAVGLEFGPDGADAMGQMFGLRELLRDGWQIYHEQAGKSPGVREGV